MRIGAVSQRDLLNTIASILFAEEVRDGGIVVGGVFEGLECILLTNFLRDVAFIEFLEKIVIIFRIAEDGYSGVVLGRGSNKSDASNVDFFHGFRNGDVDLSNGVLEGVEVANNIVDFIDILVGQVLLVGSEISCQDPCMDGGMEGLYPPREHFGGVGDGGDISAASQWTGLGLEARACESVLDIESRLSDKFCGTTRSQETDIVFDETFGQI